MQAVAVDFSFLLGLSIALGANLTSFSICTVVLKVADA